MFPSRRSLLGAAATSLAFAGYGRLAAAQGAEETYRNEVHGYGPLVPDPYGLLDLPAGFSYTVVSRAGEVMSDGLEAPYKADGMGCFAWDGDRVALVRNHELKPGDRNYGPAGLRRRLADRLDRSRAYDIGEDGHPLPGGTTTLVYDLKRRALVSQHLSLTGTAVNCAGGTTPWGSWLSCEETTVKRGQGGASRDHGWVFEVPVGARGLVEPAPLKAMGRFQHEAACVDPRTGIVYMTEDAFGRTGLFYRFLPDAPGELAKGGRLQALAFRDAPGADTSNIDEVVWRPGDWRDVRWIELDGVESPDDDLRLRGHGKGAANFARGEGVHWAGRELFFTCTAGGVAKQGQIMRYVPSAHEGRPGERDAPGRLQLFVESSDDRVLDYGDNLVVAPWGHLFICEDRYSDAERNHLRGVTPEGEVYTLARNVFRDNAELAGACFSPDGSTMFVNVYWPGVTLAVNGPWSAFRS